MMIIGTARSFFFVQACDQMFKLITCFWDRAHECFFLAVSSIFSRFAQQTLHAD